MRLARAMSIPASVSRYLIDIETTAMLHMKQKMMHMNQEVEVTKLGAKSPQPATPVKVG